MTADRIVTYGRIVAKEKPNKAEFHRVRLTVGGDRPNFTGITATQCASLTTSKCLFNSTISTRDARFMCLDIGDFYYGMPMTRYEYMHIAFASLPPEIVEQYGLARLQHNGWVYMEIRNGIPGLNQAGRISNNQLIKHLAQFGLSPAQHTPSLWRHETREIIFSLVVDDFGGKYVGKKNAEHLRDSLCTLYRVSEDWTGSKFLGLQLDWDYKNRHVDISMPKYVGDVLQKFQHAKPKRP